MTDTNNNLGIIILLLASIFFIGCGDEQDTSLTITPEGNTVETVTKCVNGKTVANTPCQPSLPHSKRAGGNTGKQGEEDIGALP